MTKHKIDQDQVRRVMEHLPESSRMYAILKNLTMPDVPALTELPPSSPLKKGSSGDLDHRNAVRCSRRPDRA